MALWTESVIHSRCEVEKWNIAPGAKSNAMGFCPKNDNPSSTMARVFCAHTSLVYSFQMVKHSSQSYVEASARSGSKGDSIWRGVDPREIVEGWQTFN
jgi:hypothetical protein